MPRYSRVIVPVVLALALALSLAACSGSVNIGTSPSPTKTEPVTYSDAKYGYSISHDAMFTQGESIKGTTAGSGSVSDVIFVDKNGTVASDTFVDAIKVSVYELARKVKPAEVPELKAEMQGMMDDVMGSLTNPEIVQPLSVVGVNGVPGFAIKYTYEDLGEQLTMTAFFLFKDKYEYQISTQSATARWDALKGKFAESVQSFTLK